MLSLSPFLSALPLSIGKKKKQETGEKRKGTPWGSALTCFSSLQKMVRKNKTFLLPKKKQAQNLPSAQKKMGNEEENCWKKNFNRQRVWAERGKALEPRLHVTVDWR